MKFDEIIIKLSWYEKLQLKLQLTTKQQIVKNTLKDIVKISNGVFFYRRGGDLYELDVETMVLTFRWCEAFPHIKLPEREIMPAMAAIVDYLSFGRLIEPSALHPIFNGHVKTAPQSKKGIAMLAKHLGFIVSEVEEPVTATRFVISQTELDLWRLEAELLTTFTLEVSVELENSVLKHFSNNCFIKTQSGFIVVDPAFFIDLRLSKCFLIMFDEWKISGDELNKELLIHQLNKSIIPQKLW